MLKILKDNGQFKNTVSIEELTFASKMENENIEAKLSALLAGED